GSRPVGERRREPVAVDATDCRKSSDYAVSQRCDVAHGPRANDQLHADLLGPDDLRRLGVRVVHRASSRRVRRQTAAVRRPGKDAARAPSRRRRRVAAQDRDVEPGSALMWLLRHAVAIVVLPVMAAVVAPMWFCRACSLTMPPIAFAAGAVMA